MIDDIYAEQVIRSTARRAAFVADYIQTYGMPANRHVFQAAIVNMELPDL